MNILIIPGEGIEHLVLPPQLRLLATNGQPAPALYREILFITYKKKQYTVKSMAFY